MHCFYKGCLDSTRSYNRRDPVDFLVPEWDLLLLEALSE